MSENLYEREGFGEMPIESAQAAALGGSAPEGDAEIAEEVELQEETREAEEIAGPLEDAVEEGGEASVEEVEVEDEEAEVEELEEGEELDDAELDDPEVESQA